MRRDTFDRDRRIAINMILSAIAVLATVNVLFVFDVPYMPFRFAATVVASISVFGTVFWVVLRHQPDWRSFAILVTAVAMLGLALPLQVQPVRVGIGELLGLSGSAVRHVFGDSMTESAFGLVIILTVTMFIQASRSRATAEQRTKELEVTRAALLESEERFRRAFEDGPLGMAFIDADLKIARANRLLCHDLGYSEQELIGKSLDSITHEEDHNVSRAVARGVFHGDVRRQSIEKRYRKKDGSYFWGRLTAAVIRDRDGKPLYSFGMVENIDRRKQMEQAQRLDQQFLRRLLDLQERERRFIAYEIHDGFVQQTVAAKMHLEAYTNGADSDRPPSPELLELAIGALDAAVGEGRRMIGELRPMIIDEGGIVAAIDYLVSDGVVKRSLPVEFQHDVRFGRLDPLLEGTIFRITQEALTNVWRHSHSDRAVVKLSHTENEIHLEIQDWGIGFDPDEVDASRFGVRGLQERARLFGGRTMIDSRPGEGTRVNVCLPIIHAQAPRELSLAHSG